LEKRLKEQAKLRQVFALAFTWLLYLIAVTFYSYQYFLRISISGIEPNLTGRLHLSALNISFIASSFLYIPVADDF